MSACSTHRGYLPALADGEVQLVPDETIKHVSACRECSQVVDAHRALSTRLRDIEDEDAFFQTQPTRKRLRWRLAGLAAVVLVITAMAGTSWFLVRGADPVEAAVAVSAQPLQIHSSDPNAVGAWCRQASGRELPEIHLNGMTVEGARMDHVASTDIVTVAYSAPSGEHVTVGWLGGKAFAGSGVEQKAVSGQEVLVVHSARGAAVVIGSSTSVIWAAAAAIESA